MAKNTYYVVFENNTQNGIESPTAQTVTGNASSVASASQGASEGTIIKGVALASVKFAENLADKVISTTLNTVELRTGHRELQERMQIGYNIIKQGADIAITSAFAGAFLGGPGAIIGLVAGVGNRLVDIGQKQLVIETKRSVENTALYYSRIRAGAGQDRTGRK